jgi:hypothetical protein
LLFAYGLTGLVLGLWQWLDARGRRAPAFAGLLATALTVVVPPLGAGIWCAARPLKVGERPALPRYAFWTAVALAHLTVAVFLGALVLLLPETFTLIPEAWLPPEATALDGALARIGELGVEQLARATLMVVIVAALVFLIVGVLGPLVLRGPKYPYVRGPELEY